MKRTVILVLCLFWFLPRVGEAQTKSAKSEKFFNDSEFFRELAYLRIGEILINSQFYADVPDQEKLVHAALKGMVSALHDPYSNFLTAKEFWYYNHIFFTDTVGLIGIEIETADSCLIITNVQDKSSADEARLEVGYKIYSIDGAKTKGMLKGEAITALAGPLNSLVSLEVLKTRNHKKQKLSLRRSFWRIEKDEFKCQIFEDSIFVLSLPNFEQRNIDTIESFVYDVMNYFPKARFVFDFRNNGGGPVISADRFISLWLPRGETIYFELGRDSEKIVKVETRKFFAPLRDRQEVFLVNKGTASASEMVIGALKDYDLAVTVGEETFGKNLIQTCFLMPDSSRITLTTNRWLTPNRISVKGVGLKLDFKILPLNDQTKNPQDVQLFKALEVARNLKR
ncbi:MAG: S41 family peptidase [Patescibacteria group bacterium]